MISDAVVTHSFMTEEGLYMQLFVPMVTDDFFKCRNTDRVEVVFVDDNSITAEQRKRIYATLADIADELGYTKEECKYIFKDLFMKEYGIKTEISFKDCTKDLASDFIDFLLEFCFYHNIALKEEYGINRCYNVTAYLGLCLKYRKCCICGRKADLHHDDAIGMGADRNHYDDTKNRKMALCRVHHTERHQIGPEAFNQKYHVYGILWNDEPKDTWTKIMEGEENEDYEIESSQCAD